MGATTQAAREIRLIQIGRSALRLDDDTYRSMLAGLCNGKTSSTKLTADERAKVLQHLKASGFVIQPKAGGPTALEAGWQRAPQMRKLRAMWYALAAAGHVDEPDDIEACNAAIETWAKRQLNTGLHPVLHSMRFATGAQMDKLIEMLKRWHRRVGLDTTA